MEAATMSGRKLKDLTGQRFGKLTVTTVAEHRRTRAGGIEIHWECKCDCGNIKTVRRTHLMDGSTKSCGCIGPGNYAHRSKFGELHTYLSSHLGSRYLDFCDALPDELRLKDVELENIKSREFM